MAADEWRAFVSEGTHTAKVATVRRDGHPHVVPVWFVLDDGGRVVFTTGADTVKGRALRLEPRVSVGVDDERPPFSFVRIDGTAELSDDLDELRAWATRIGGRYMGADRAEEFGRRNAVPEERLVRVTPTRVVAVAGMTD